MTPWGPTAVTVILLIGPAAAGAAQPGSAHQELSDFAKQVLVPDLYDNEQESEIQPRPEIFIQTRFSRGRVDGATDEEATQNFELSRIEARWAGRLSDRVGVGLELQFHPALEGAAEELVNDAFVEFYLARGVTVRAGQFVKPWGFDVPRSSAEREFPERGMFAGSFFPGQRDRGLMLMWDLDDAGPILEHTRLYAAMLNGNRFFADVDDRLDALVRVRRVFPSIGVAAGASLQVGHQLLPPGTNGGDGVTIVGVDVQKAFQRIGVRLEWVRGTRPSTLLALEPEFTPAFAPGLHTAGVAAGAIYRLSSADQAYARVDVLDGDPITGARARGVDLGFVHVVDEHARFGVNWQWKDHPTFNDDAVNTRFQVTLGVVF